MSTRFSLNLINNGILLHLSLSNYGKHHLPRRFRHVFFVLSLFIHSNHGSNEQHYTNLNDDEY